MTKLGASGEENMDDILANIRRMIASEPQKPSTPTDGNQVSAPVADIPIARTAKTHSTDALLEDLVETPGSAQPHALLFSTLEPGQRWQSDAQPISSKVGNKTYDVLSDKVSVALAAVKSEQKSEIAPSSAQAEPTLVLQLPSVIPLSSALAPLSLDVPIAKLMSHPHMEQPVSLAAAPPSNGAAMGATSGITREFKSTLPPDFGGGSAPKDRIKPFDLGQLRPSRDEGGSMVPGLWRRDANGGETPAADAPASVSATEVSTVQVIQQPTPEAAWAPAIGPVAAAAATSHGLLARVTKIVGDDASDQSAALDVATAKSGATIDDEATAAPDQVSHGAEATTAVATVISDPTPTETVVESAAQVPAPVQAPATEDAVADLLKPMLRQWLDDNMPRIVEKALRSGLDRGSKSS
jgi:uncharacterized protein